MAIFEAICKGKTKTKKLIELRHGNCRKSEVEIARALETNGRMDYLFALQQELDMYKTIQLKITACDTEIEKKISNIIDEGENKRH